METSSALGESTSAARRSSAGSSSPPPPPPARVPRPPLAEVARDASSSPFAAAAVSESSEWSPGCLDGDALAAARFRFRHLARASGRGSREGRERVRVLGVRKLRGAKRGSSGGART